MTDKHFTALADMLLELRPIFREYQSQSNAPAIVKHLKNRYRRFDPKRFRRHFEAH